MVAALQFVGAFFIRKQVQSIITNPTFCTLLSIFRSLAKAAILKLESIAFFNIELRVGHSENTICRLYLLLEYTVFKSMKTIKIACFFISSLR